MDRLADEFGLLVREAAYADYDSFGCVYRYPAFALQEGAAVAYRYEVTKETNRLDLARAFRDAFADGFHYCTACGKPIEAHGPNSRYCEECGAAVTGMTRKLRNRRFRSRRRI